MTATKSGSQIPSARRTISGVHINDVLDPDELARAQSLGHVRQQLHPTEPLAILNYTEVCAYEGGWTPVTLACRGLIHRTDTGEVVARGFNKFFNYGQPGAPELDLNGWALVTDKADGSLGILYPVPSGGWAVATRGSFTSDQALHATEVFRERYAAFRSTPGVTTLFEIVYPQNRIVLDYDGLDDLILLGGVEIATGTVYDPSWFGQWNGPVTQTFPAATLAEALAMEPRPNAEGVVVRMLDTGHMVKIKYEEYVRLHKVVTGLNARSVWEHLSVGNALDELVAPLPDEFHDWARNVAYVLTKRIDDRHDEIERAYAQIRAALPPELERKAFAALAVRHPDKWAMFNLLDGKDIRGELWKRAKPEPGWTPSGRVFTEDVA